MSLFHHALEKFIEHTYPETTRHPLEDPKTIESWGIDFSLRRPLPRVSFHSELGVQKVSAPFQDLETLKKMCIDSSLLALYRTAPKIPKVTLLTYVYWDGLGDYFSAKHCSDFLRSSGIDVEEIFLFKNEASLPQEKNAFCFHPNQKVALPQSIIETMQKSDVILEFPTYYPFTKSLKKEVGKGPKWEYLGEIGFVETPDYYPGQGRRCLGLHPLEKGLLIPHLPPLKNSPLNPPYFFAYTRTVEGLRRYIEAISHEPQEEITLCTFKMPLVKTLLSEGLPKNITALHLYYQNEKHSKISHRPGTTLHLHVFDLCDHRAFLSLMKGSNPFVACTGDASFSEALALNKIIFYDCPSHKEDFWKDLLAFAKEKHPETLPFFETPALFQSLEKPFLGLTHDLRETCSANATLLSIIYRATLHKLLPDIEEKEHHLLEQFAKGKIDGTQMLAMLNKEL